ncbi:hypothetical protein ACIGKQ_21150 [Gordonia sp. NPDC062954]|uniref:hypothetical protein n=1 Tax=Gordonia sp. NPDC062954 TaxID=3364003 RepID=UPI0037CC74B1
MERLNPPRVPEPEPPPPPGWWYTGHDATICRDDFLAEWRARMRPPTPDTKSVKNQLNRWAGNLGRAGWTSSEYHPSVRTLLCEPRTSSAEVDGWNAASVICADFVEPFARYTAGWVDSLHEIRPSPLPGAVGRHLRDMCRAVTKPLGDNMVAAKPGVIATRSAARKFVRDQSQRHHIDSEIVLQRYASLLGDFIEGMVLAQLGYDDPEIHTRIADHYDLVISMLGEQTPRREYTDDEIADFDIRVREFLAAAFAARGVQRDADAGEAFIRLHTTGMNRLRGGIPLEGLQYHIPLRFRAIAAERKRERSRATEIPVDPETGRTFASKRDGLPPEVADEIARAIRRIRDDPTLALADGTRVWEAEFAADLLAEVILGDSLMTERELKTHITELWKCGRPTNARSTGPHLAARDVALLIRIALTHARETGDD